VYYKEFLTKECDKLQKKVALNWLQRKNVENQHWENQQEMLNEIRERKLQILQVINMGLIILF